MNHITFSEDKAGNFRIIYNTVEEIEKTLTDGKFKFWYANKYARVKMYKRDDKEAIKNAIMKFGVIDEEKAIQEIIFAICNDKIKVMFDYNIKVIECIKNIPGSKYDGQTKSWEIDNFFRDELKEKIHSLKMFKIVEKQ